MLFLDIFPSVLHGRTERSSSCWEHPLVIILPSKNNHIRDGSIVACVRLAQDSRIEWCLDKLDLVYRNHISYPVFHRRNTTNISKSY